MKVRVLTLLIVGLISTFAIAGEETDGVEIGGIEIGGVEIHGNEWVG